jgi:hypothetical protein
VNLQLPPSSVIDALPPCATGFPLCPQSPASGTLSPYGMCSTLHATRCDKGAIRFGSCRSFHRIFLASPSPVLNTPRTSLPISTNNGACLRDQGLQCTKGNTMPTHKGSYMLSGQNEGPGETTNEKSHTLLKSLCLLGAQSRDHSNMKQIRPLVSTLQ